MYFGYNTNGLAHHALCDGVELLAELGYAGVAITIDHCALNPWKPHLVAEIDHVLHTLQRLNMRTVIETGARFLLDPRKKHTPTLLAVEPEGRELRVRFLKAAIDIASELGSDCVSLWSGAAPEGASEAESWERLCKGLEEVVKHAERSNVILGFEPEPGMFIDRMSRFDELLHRVNSSALRLTLDVGHVHCLQDGSIPSVIERYADRLVNVHIEDMRAGVHEHLMFGEGEIDFAPLFDAFKKTGYAGGVFVELSRHSHDAPRVAAESLAFLKRIVDG